MNITQNERLKESNGFTIIHGVMRFVYVCGIVIKYGNFDWDFGGLGIGMIKKEVILRQNVNERK